MDPIHLEFTYTPDDLAEAARVPVRDPASEPPSWRRSISLVVIAGGLGAIFALRAYFERPAPRPASPPMPPATMEWLPHLLPWVLIFGLIFTFVYRQIRATSPRAVWARTPSLQQPKTMTVDDAGITQADSHASTRWEWAAFNGWTETTNLLLLHQTGNVMLIVPKRAAASDGQLAALRAALSARIVEPHGGFPVLPSAAAAASPSPSPPQPLAADARPLAASREDGRS